MAAVRDVVAMGRDPHKGPFDRVGMTELGEWMFGSLAGGDRRLPP
jgi:ABC-type cobalamin/Fe3+-siderophores transport system ATPase subunit